jgi:hypothetical protein
MAARLLRGGMAAILFVSTLLLAPINHTCIFT